MGVLGVLRDDGQPAPEAKPWLVPTRRLASHLALDLHYVCTYMGHARLSL